MNNLKSIAKADVQMQLADFAANGDLTQMPENGWNTAIQQIIDTIAVGWAGSNADGVAQAAELAIEDSSQHCALLWGREESVSAAQASFVNGVAAAALDYDCVHQESLLHPAAITVPIALALASEVNASGEKLIAAHIVGSELMCRLSMATPRQSNWFAGSIYGIFGATACAGYLLDLSPQQMQNAFGLALAQTSGTKQAITERKLAKRFQTAFAARSGVLSARLALRGVTAANNWLDGTAGLFALYEAGDPMLAVHDLGNSFTFDQATIKKYPSCLCTHVVIDGVCRLLQDNNVAINDVSSIDTTITKYMSRIVGARYEPGDNPQVAAQFSAAYTAACALTHGGVTLADIEMKAATDPQRVELAQSISVTTFDDIDGHVAPAKVSLTLKNGITHSIDVTKVPNAANGPDADNILRRKSIDCFTRGQTPLSEASANELVNRLLELRARTNVRDLFDNL